MPKTAQYCASIFENTSPVNFYQVGFKLDRLVPGVDNIRYDVNISEEFCRLTDELISALLNDEIKALNVRSPEKPSGRNGKDWEAFKKTYSEVMLSAVNRAKQAREPQVIFLAQAAVTKLVLEKIQRQFEALVRKCKKLIRNHEVSRGYELGDVFRIKEDMAVIQQNRQVLSRHVSRELIRHVGESWKENVLKTCVANFGNDVWLPKEFFFNPVLSVNGNTDDFFMIKRYALLGHRMDDPLRYEAFLGLIKNFLAEADIFGAMAIEEQTLDTKEAANYEESGELDERYKTIGRLLCNVKIIDVLFDSYQTQSLFKEAKSDKADKAELQRLKQLGAAQKKLFDEFYKECKKTGPLPAIIAYYQMQALLSRYCPPLLPHDVLNFLISPGERDKITTKFKRIKSLSGQSFSLKPLYRLARNYQKVRKSKKKKYLLEFLKTFATYHRDRENFQQMKENLQWVNLIDDEKTMNLSRVNNTLYEFLGAEEAVPESKPIRNHVILKADLRGSTEITSQLSQKKLNPASYFSLNFFDPINKVLPEYRANKVFIEGDALILSIFEEEESPEGWYAVARACGLAIRMLRIVRIYNEKSQKHRLPVLEQGIGICYTDAPPAFLFDGDNRIMISSAINRADRLSGCTKFLRRYFANRKEMFNLYVFALPSANEEDEMSYWRYNVNGIELESAGFEKLKKEIDLTTLNILPAENSKNKVRVHTGIFPTSSGKYQRLVVREARIPQIDAQTMKIKGHTSRKYYEICTHSTIYERVKAEL